MVGHLRPLGRNCRISRRLHLLYLAKNWGQSGPGANEDSRGGGDPIITTHTPATVQATVHDTTAMAHTWGFEDALAGMDQRGSQFFLIGSPAWEAYNEGFAAGNQMFYSLTGLQRFVFIPQEN